MADGGVTEAAILAAAAEGAGGAAAAGGTAAALAAAAPEVIGAGTAAAGAGAAAAAAAPEIAAATAPELVGATAAAAPAVESAPIFLGAAESAPEVTGGAGTGLLGTSFGPPTASEASAGGLLGGATEFGPPTAAEASAYPGLVTGGPITPGQVAAPYAPQWGGLNLGSGSIVDPTKADLLDKLGMWWTNTSLGDKLSAGGKVLGGAQTAAKAITPSTPTKGPSRTMAPGRVGQPTGGEQVLAQLVKALLDRRDQYGLTGAPVAYRPRSLLG